MTSTIKIFMTAAALAAPAAAVAAQPAPATQCTVSIVRLPTGDANRHAVQGAQSTIADSIPKIDLVRATSQANSANGECPRNYYPIDIAAMVQLPEASEEGQQPAELRSAYYITCQ